MTRLDRCDGGYVIAGRKTGADDLLDTVMKLDDELGGSFTLTVAQNEALGRLFAGYVAVPDFTEVSFMEASSALFSYLAGSGDDVLASQVARAMGWMSQDEHMARIRSSAPSSESYRAYWRTLAQEVLTYEGFDDFRFGSVKIAFDVALVAISTAMSLVFFGELRGIGIGTLATALLVGRFCNLCNRRVPLIAHIAGLSRSATGAPHEAI